MKITAASTLPQVAGAVGGALKRAGISAVLTGGACATIHSRGKYLSEDLDFVIQGSALRRDLERVMGDLGFERRGEQYFHDKSPFFVEFLRGPLGIGRDIVIQPVEIRVGESRVLALSSHDSCRDRLAAFIFWNDRQSLEAAVEIALRNDLDMKAIRRWAATEGGEERFEEFLAQVRKRKRERPSSARSRR